MTNMYGYQFTIFTKFGALADKRNFKLSPTMVKYFFLRTNIKRTTKNIRSRICQSIKKLARYYIAVIKYFASSKSLKLTYFTAF